MSTLLVRVAGGLDLPSTHSIVDATVGGATAPRPRRGRRSTVEGRGPWVAGGGRDLGELRAPRTRRAPALTRPASLRPRSMGRTFARAASGGRRHPSPHAG